MPETLDRSENYMKSCQYGYAREAPCWRRKCGVEKARAQELPGTQSQAELVTLGHTHFPQHEVPRRNNRQRTGPHILVTSEFPCP